MINNKAGKIGVREGLVILVFIFMIPLLIKLPLFSDLVGKTPYMIMIGSKL